jgi:hypothetical protein
MWTVERLYSGETLPRVWVEIHVAGQRHVAAGDVVIPRNPRDFPRVTFRLEQGAASAPFTFEWSAEAIVRALNGDHATLKA